MTLMRPLFSPRLTKLLLELLKQDDYVSTESLAKSINTSKRTLFREISGCNALLEPYQIELISKTGLGVKVEGSESNKQLLLSLLNELALSSGYYDIDKRRMLLTAEILKNKSISKLIHYAQIFDVSEATISNDLTVLEEWFSMYRLRLTKKPGYGIELVGNEDDVRKAMTDFVHDQLKENKLIDLIYLYEDDFDLKEYFSQYDNASILSLLNDKILTKVIKVIRTSEFKYVQKMADSSLIGLIIHLTIAIERLLSDEIISMDDVLLKTLESDEDYSKAKMLTKSVEQAFEIKFPKAEIAFILMHLKGARLRDMQVDQNRSTSIDDIKLKQTILKMIESFQKIMNVDMLDDDVLIKGLLTHLRPAITRLDYKLSIRNPLLEQIQTQYTDIFEASKQAVVALEEGLKQPIPIDEVGYVALHFGAAMERYHQKMNEHMSLKIGVVCASGIGISSLLSSRIKNIFLDLQMVVPLALEDVNPQIAKQLDLLITTMPLEHSPIPTVFVQPLLSDQDIENISVAIKECKQSKREGLIAPSVDNKQDPLETLAQINLMIQKLRKQFSITTLDHTLSYEQIIDKVSHLSGAHAKQAKEIKSALLLREQHGSVFVKEAKLLLLHAKIEHLDQPILKLYNSKEAFIHLSDQPTYQIMVMIASKKGDANAVKMLSMISSSLIEENHFVQTLLEQQENDIHHALESILQKWYRNETMARLKNL